MSLIFKISTVKINKFQAISWLTCSIALLNNPNYINSLHGLLGNNNEDRSDDVISRISVKSDDIKNEKKIYKSALTWKLTARDSSLFTVSYENTNMHKNRRLLTPEDNGEYIPKFFEDLTVSSTLNESCNQVKACIFDSIIVGSMLAGLDTKDQLQLKQLAQVRISESPPLIKFRTEQIRVDWNDQNPIIIIADINDSNDNFTVLFNISNAQYVVTDAIKITPGHTIATITYYPKENELPVFE